MGVPTEGRERSPEPPDYEDEFLRYLWREYLYPKQYEWVLIAAYVAVFFVALVGNTLGRSPGLWECCGVPLGTGRGPGSIVLVSRTQGLKSLHINAGSSG